MKEWVRVRVRCALSSYHITSLSFSGCICLRALSFFGAVKLAVTQFVCLALKPGTRFGGCKLIQNSWLVLGLKPCGFNG